jgi:cytoskeletal protein CcmA (bactofilin family)
MAWNKRDEPSPQPDPSPLPSRPVTGSAPSTPIPSPSEPSRRTGERATIGPSIFIVGDLTGDEDLVIEGRVEGKVDLKQNNVTVGKNGRVRADVFGRTVIIEGEVDGNVFAQEQAILRTSGAIRGNIASPRVVLEDGSRFKGSIDMEPKENRSGAPARSETSQKPQAVEGANTKQAATA